MYKYSDKHPEISELTVALFHFFDDLLFGFKIEEQILFPNIIQLVEKNNCTHSYGYTTFGRIKELVLELQKEHTTTLKKLKWIQELTKGYRIPADACVSYRAFLENMKELETDLIQYVHLENSVLFPKAILADEGSTV